MLFRAEKSLCSAMSCGVISEKRSGAIKSVTISAPVSARNDAASAAPLAGMFWFTAAESIACRRIAARLFSSSSARKRSSKASCAEHRRFFVSAAACWPRATAAPKALTRRFRTRRSALRSSPPRRSATSITLIGLGADALCSGR